MTRRRVQHRGEKHNVPAQAASSETWFITARKGTSRLIRAKTGPGRYDTVARVLGPPGPQQDNRARLIAAVPVILALLDKAATALEEEVGAAGDEGHPVIRAHAKIARDARVLLARIRGQ
jgi:hypothetical protein